MNISGKYLKVWKVQEQNGFTKLDLGDSKKLKDGGYDNFTWFGCTLVGNAKNVAVNEKDTIEIKSGLITKRKGNDGKWYDDVVIFEFEVMEKKEKTDIPANSLPDGFQELDNPELDDENPF